MFCKNCGANISSNVLECQYCGSANLQESNERIEEKVASPVSQRETPVTTNPLLGKEYSFSGNDLVIRGRYGVRFNVMIGEDRLNFETVPAKKNKLPAVMLEDIMAIQESFHMRKTNIILAILGLLLGFAGGYWGFILPILVLLFFRERKMKIHLRNGNSLTIYSGNKESINEFIEDMKKITKIKK